MVGIEDGTICSN